MGRIQAPKWVHGPKSETAVLEINKLLSDLRYLFWGSLWVILWLIKRNVYLVIISVPGTEILKPCKFLWYEPVSIFCNVSEVTFGKPLGHVKGWGAKKEGLVARGTNHVRLELLHFMTAGEGRGPSWRQSSITNGQCLSRLCLYNEASLKIQKEGVQKASRLLNTRIFWEEGKYAETANIPREHGSYKALSPCVTECTSSIWLTLS